MCESGEVTEVELKTLLDLHYEENSETAAFRKRFFEMSGNTNTGALSEQSISGGSVDAVEVAGSGGAGVASKKGGDQVLGVNTEKLAATQRASREYTADFFRKQVYKTDEKSASGIDVDSAAANIRVTKKLFKENAKKVEGILNFNSFGFDDPSRAPENVV